VGENAADDLAKGWIVSEGGVTVVA
jgi:hypothetical protein